MKRLFLALVLVLANLFTALPANVFAGTNDFRFKDFTADYYLKKTADQTSEMEVVETVTAVFPNYNQNHGIERYIPFLNQNDTNLTTESASGLKVEVTRNGSPEPVHVGVFDNHFVARIGKKDTYVHGEQTYVIKYKFVRVITAFEASRYAETAYQELYWNTNGTESAQTFESVTANLHFDDEIKHAILKDRNFSKTPDYRNKAFISETNETKDKLAAWCYVGTKSSNNQSRCKITDLPDGISFSTGQLASYENLTFAINFEDKTFNVPKNNYIDKLSIKDARFDYYLTKDSSGYANLKVKSKLTALLPSKDLVKTFDFFIPYVNQTGASFTTDSQTKLPVRITFDDQSVEQFKLSKEERLFKISIKPDSNSTIDYLHGEHKIELEYELKNIILAANTSANPAYNERLNYQVFEITPLEHFYKDVSNYTVNLHLSDDIKANLMPIKNQLAIAEFTAFCDDGSSENIKKRTCTTSKTDDGFTFYASNISSPRFFKIFVNFKQDTFNIPEPNRNFLYYHLFVITLIILSIIIFCFYRFAYKPVQSKLDFFKNRPIVPEYTPHKNFSVTELAQNYLGYTRNQKVAGLLELIVQQKVELKKYHKNSWSIKVVDLEALTPFQKDLITILNNGHDFSLNDEIQITQHGYSKRLEDCFNRYEKNLLNALKAKGCFETEKTNKNHSMDFDFSIKNSVRTTASSIIKILLFFFAVHAIIGVMPVIITAYLSFTNFNPYSIYEGAFLIPAMIIMVFLTTLILPSLHSRYQKYASRTILGLELSRYLDGLKLYIKMAEADRLEFLQSLENVDTTSECIVKLHEKLLPHAALFGLEKSWMKELEQYYILAQDSTPNWYAAGLNYSSLRAVNSIVHSAVARPIDVSSSSSGGFSHSSGSSGGGGGGHSGGGGGGGGFGGW